MELGINIDNVTVNPTSISVFLSAGSPGDQFRVLTAAPEPGTEALLVLAGCMLLKKKW